MFVVFVLLWNCVCFETQDTFLKYVLIKVKPDWVITLIDQQQVTLGPSRRRSNRDVYPFTVFHLSSQVPKCGLVFSISYVTHKRGSMSFLVSVYLVLLILEMCSHSQFPGQGFSVIPDLRLSLQSSFLIDIFIEVCFLPGRRLNPCKGIGL